MLEKITACPCQTGKRYAECCQPFHLKQAFASTAEQLMRSRYSAYTLINIPYIVETTVPSQQKLLDQTAMKEWAENTKWVGLSVLNHLPSLSKIHSQVEFKAFFDTEEGKQAHHESSLFVSINERWYFVDPTVTLPNQKQPCVCGSGKKFKHCCGNYL
ncbi:YchJ family protein [Mannheimia haemolytica]|uniref:YchJ family protein n=1 Tax=Mannheimia haemolytica TaxID=75985 RepID=UPI000DA38F85|nr:YchJ family protein [Mannheimia haemolytica]SQE30232.1 SWIM/SEC-C metal-binding motif protein, PBPRA1643 family [Mannheimia haemolytica]